LNSRQPEAPAPSAQPDFLIRHGVTVVVAVVVALSTVATEAGRDRLSGWFKLAYSALYRPTLASVFSVSPSRLSVEQARAARWIARKHRIALEPTEQIVLAAFAAATDHRVDPYLVLSVISIESAFNPLAESSAGAKGLMQVMPQPHAARFEPYGGLDAALNPEANIQVGTQILREYLDRYLTAEAALAAYVGVGPSGETSYPEKILITRDRIHAAAMGRVLASAELASDR